MKVQVHRSLEPPLEYNQSQTLLMNQGFLTILEVREILCSFRLVPERKTGKETPKSSRLEFLEMLLANNFVLSDAKDSTSGPLNRGGTADLLLLRTLLAIRQKSRNPSFWKVMDSFVSLAYVVKCLKKGFRLLKINVHDIA